MWWVAMHTHAEHKFARINSKPSWTMSLAGHVVIGHVYTCWTQAYKMTNLSLREPWPLQWDVVSGDAQTSWTQVCKTQLKANLNHGPCWTCGEWRCILTLNTSLQESNQSRKWTLTLAGHVVSGDVYTCWTQVGKNQIKGFVNHGPCPRFRSFVPEAKNTKTIPVGWHLPTSCKLHSVYESVPQSTSSQTHTFRSYLTWACLLQSVRGSSYHGFHVDDSIYFRMSISYKWLCFPHPYHDSMLSTHISMTACFPHPCQWLHAVHVHIMFECSPGKAIVR